MKREEKSEQMRLCEIHYSQDSISAKFRDGHELGKTIQQLKSDDIDVLDLPVIRVVQLVDGKYTSKCKTQCGIQLLEIFHDENCNLNAPNPGMVTWHTLDNRRLYCFKEADVGTFRDVAGKPGVDGYAIPVRKIDCVLPEEELRKFTSKTIGRQVNIVRRN